MGFGLPSMTPAPLCLTELVAAFSSFSFLLCFSFPLLEAAVCVLCRAETRTLSELVTWLYLDNHRSGG